MTFIKEKIISWFDAVLIGLLIKRFGLPEANAEPISACPELEMLAAYMEENLSPQMAREIAGHVGICRPCRKLLISARRSQELVPDPVFSQRKES